MRIASTVRRGRVYELLPERTLIVYEPDGTEWSWCVNPEAYYSFVHPRGGWSAERGRLLEWYLRHAEEVVEMAAEKDAYL